MYYMIVMGFDHDKKGVSTTGYKNFLGESWGDKGYDNFAWIPAFLPGMDTFLSRVAYPILSDKCLLAAHRVYDNSF